ncbi:DUF262 domain-containing protein [Haloferax volcanii]|uniref:DUF262 domain-containing protein n=1 Tax=Haloferax volcanii TaxID=2246 RepID=UPI00249C7190|nr:DUF262 domain-containing protein [Haloferax alexandrinus]
MERKHSFSGNVSLGHSTTSVNSLVSRLIDAEKSNSTTDNPPITIPSLQREFCWGMSEIEALFDSLLRGLPIGTLLLWNADPNDEEAAREAKYQFIRHYADRSNFPSEKSDLPVRYHSGKVVNDESFEEYTFALDGQQRLTSFLIGLRGSYFDHRSRKHTDKLRSYYQKYLCLNLLNDPNREPEDAQEHIFEFNFRRLEDPDTVLYKPESNALWYPVRLAWKNSGHSLSERIELPDEVRRDEQLNKYTTANLARLQEALHAPQIPCEEVSQMRNEEALELFIRRNKGGEELSNSDIAFSLITVYWDQFDEGEDPKEVFESKGTELSKNFSKYGFGFGKGFLIRSLLYLNDEKPSFEQDNLIPDVISPLEETWGEDFFTALRLTFEIVTDGFGVTSKCIGGKTALLPLLYYCYNRVVEDGASAVSDILEAERLKMEYWVQLPVFTNLFSVSSSMTVLNGVRPLISNSSSFPIHSILEKYDSEEVRLKLTRKSREGTTTVKKLVNGADHGNETIQRNYLLTSLYDDRGVGMDHIDEDGEVTSMEVDHFFPASKLRNKKNYLDNQDFGVNDEELSKLKSYCNENVSRFGNFTLLAHGSENQSKGEKDPEDWLEKMNGDLSDLIEMHRLPETRPYSYERYETFLNTREPELISQLEEQLVLYEDI